MQNKDSSNSTIGKEDTGSPLPLTQAPDIDQQLMIKSFTGFGFQIASGMVRG